MLIVLNFPENFSEKEDFARELIKDTKGTFSIVLPKTFQDYVSLIKKYRPKKTSHLIILKSHYDYLRTEPEGAWRTAEFLLQTRGGEVWGEPPTRDSMTYAGTFDNAKNVLVQASYNGHRAIIFDALSRNYIGRTQSDPHTAIVGFKPTPPDRVTRVSEFLISGLPDEWWKGVAFLDNNSVGPLEKTLHWLENTNIVSIGDVGHQKLTDLNVEHGAMPEVSKLYKSKNQNAASQYGIMLRNTAGTQTDNRSWKI